MILRPPEREFELPFDAILTLVSKAITRGKIFIAQTPGTQFISESVVSLIQDGARGMTICAETTFGKTQCLVLLCETISADLGGFVPHVMLEKLPKGKVGALLLDICEELGFNLNEHSSIRERVNKIVLAMYQSALRSPFRIFILAIDEAHSITGDQAQILKTIGNKLEKKGCDLFLILAGQESLFDLESKLRKEIPKEVDQLAERFFNNRRLRGLRSEAQLTSFLVNFGLADHPPGYLLVGRYIPRALQGGFKIETIAPMFWKVIVEATPPALQDQVEIGIGHVIKTLVGYLTASAPTDAVNFGADNAEEVLRKELAKTRFARSMNMRLGKLADEEEHELQR